MDGQFLCETKRNEMSMINTILPVAPFFFASPWACIVTSFGTAFPVYILFLAFFPTTGDWSVICSSSED